MPIYERFPGPNWKRRAILAAVVLLAPVLWKVGLRVAPSLTHRGEGTPPAMLKFQALALIKGSLGYPRPVEGALPKPAKGSGAAAQLALMGWWDGHTWTPKALARGRVSGQELKVGLGHLALVGVVDVTPSRDYNGPQLCQADYRVRWDVPESEAELLRARSLVGLRNPKGLQTPGEELFQQVTLERTFLGWKVQDAAGLDGAGAGRGRALWAWLGWLF